MASTNRTRKGQTGEPTTNVGHFGSKQYTEADVTLAGAAVSARWKAVREAERAALQDSAKYLRAVILSQHPDAAYVELSEADTEGSSWYGAAVTDADGNDLEADAALDDLYGSFTELPYEPVMDYDEQTLESTLAPGFEWLEFNPSGYTARIVLGRIAD